MAVEEAHCSDICCIGSASAANVQKSVFRRRPQTRGSAGVFSLAGNHCRTARPRTRGSDSAQEASDQEASHWQPLGAQFSRPCESIIVKLHYCIQLSNHIFRNAMD